MANCIIVMSGGGGVGSDELTAKAAQVLNGYTYVGNDTDDEAGTGTMVNRGAVAPSALAAGGSYTIPAGYHNGSGKVVVQSLATITSGGTVNNASQILSGYKAYSDGTLYTGNMANNGAVSKTITPSASAQSYTIPVGYHNGSGKVNVGAIPSDYIRLTDSSVSFSFGTIASMLGGVVPQYVRRTDGIYQQDGEDVEYSDGYPLLKKNSSSNMYQLLVFKKPIHVSLFSAITTVIGRTDSGLSHGFRLIKLDKTDTFAGSTGSQSGTSTDDYPATYTRNDDWTDEWGFLSIYCNNAVGKDVYLKEVGFTLL